MNRPYNVYRNGLLYRKRKNLSFALKDMRELQKLGFVASVAEDITGE